MSRTLVLTVFLAEAGEIQRKLDGSPKVASGRAAQASLILATPSGDGSWMVETWTDPGSRVELAPNADGLTAGIARVVLDIVNAEE